MIEKQQDQRIEEADAKDLPQILELLKGSGLTTEGLNDAALWVIRAEGGITGVVGLEIWGKRQGLLRSLVVSKNLRNKGLGSSLVEHVIDFARKKDLEEVFLLTSDVPSYYVKFGFRNVERASVVGEVLNSAEFRGACLDTATVMQITI